MHLQQVEKLHIALEQLEDALQAYFTGRFHSAIVLAGAAEQLFGGYVLKHGHTPSWKETRSIVTKIANAFRRDASENVTSEDDIGSVMNRAYNESRHAGKSDHSVVMDPEFEAKAVIDRAISNYHLLEARGLPDVREIPDVHRFLAASAGEVRTL